MTMTLDRTPTTAPKGERPAPAKSNPPRGKTKPKAAPRRFWLRGRRTHRWLRRLGVGAINDDPTFTSTRQVEPLCPVRAASSKEVLGPLMGKNLTDGTAFTHSIFGLYKAGVIAGPNAVIIGGYGFGKSSTAKTVYGTRALAAGARVVVFDRKRQREGTTLSGEYLRLAEVTGGTVLRLSRHDGTRINILDPQIVTTGSEDTMVGQDELLLMVAAAACGGPLVDTATSAPAYALRTAHKAALAAAADQGAVATLADVIEHLYRPQVEAVPGPVLEDGTKLLTQEGLVSRSDLIRWGLPVAMNLERFTTGDWSGLIDGETRNAEGGQLRLGNQLLVIDTSALPEGSPLLALMMVIMSTYISSAFASIPGPKILIQEEAYSMDRLDLVPAVFRALAKRGRAVGLCLVTIIHHLSDLKEGSDLWSLVRETEVIHIFRQDKRQDADQVIEFFNLPSWVRETLFTLDKGHQIVKVGKEPPVVVQHLRTNLEEWLTFTDGAMTEASEPAPFIGGEE